MNPFPGDAREAFEVAVRIDAGTVLVAVRGEVDVVTARDLDAVMATLAESGHRRVVLDLGACTFTGVDGLRIIANGAAALAPSGGRLVVRWASSVVGHLIEIVGITAVDIEPTGARSAGAVAALSQPSGGTDLAPPARVVEHTNLRQLTAIPAAQDVVDGAIRLVVSLAEATIGGADGVSVTLNREGWLTTVAASDTTVAAMDAEQYATGEGPCVEAAMTGQASYAESLGDESRWPAFTPRAIRLGINAILSAPLLAGGRPAGALNIYSRTVNAFAGADQQLASSFAAHATTILTDAGVGTAAKEVTERLAAALRGREVIAQAQGVLMSRGHINPSDAYTLMRHSAVDGGRRLADVAAEVVASAQGPPPDQEAGRRG